MTTLTAHEMGLQGHQIISATLKSRSMNSLRLLNYAEVMLTSTLPVAIPNLSTCNNGIHQAITNRLNHTPNINHRQSIYLQCIK